MSDLIEKRDERTKKRKIIKRKMDSIIGLSYHDKDKKVMSFSTETKLSDKRARLLDEGYIDNGFVIKKGTLEKYLNGENQYVRGWEFDGEQWVQTEVLNLTSDFKGTVNLGHIDFATLPIILGSWTKDDLSLVDIENDRHALDVNLHLDEESVFVKELKRQPFDIGISAEFWVHQNEEDTENLSEMLGYYIPVIDEVYIFAYGLVGECGNVNSSGLELKGDAMELPNEVIEHENDVIEVENDVVAVEEDEVETESEEEAIEEVSEVSEETAEPEILEEVEEVEVDEVEDEEDEDEEDEYDEITSQVEALNVRIGELEAENASLKSHIEALKKDNRRLSAKLQNEKEKKKAFFEKAKGISAKLGINEGIKEEKSTNGTIASGDGIGD